VALGVKSLRRRMNVMMCGDHDERPDATGGEEPKEGGEGGGKPPVRP